MQIATYPRPWVRRLYRFAYDRLYNELAWGYDAVSWMVSLGHWDRWRRQALRFVQGERVLEVGFGTGSLLPLLHVKAQRTVGLEVSAAMHHIAAHKLYRRGMRVPRVQGIVQWLPFADSSFDGIVTTFPAQFILDPGAHREFARVLRPGGRLIVVDLRLAAANPLVRTSFHLVFPPVKEARQRFIEAIHAAGLSMTEYPLGTGPVQVVVTVAEKRE